MNKTLSLLLSLFFILFGQLGFSQNLVNNPSFEDYSYCPNALSEIGAPGNTTSPDHWYRPTTGSPDYFNRCATAMVGVPVNTFGNMQPRTGDGYVGMHIWTSREYVQTRLKETMVAGHQYYVSFWVAASQRYQAWYFDQLGAYFDRGYTDTFTTNNLPRNAQVKSPKGQFLSTNSEWEKVEGYYTAQGGENNIIIGNFTPYDQQDTSRRGTTTGISAVYYYFDDVCVLDISAAGRVHDTFVCDSTITLHAPAGFDHYLWSTGDTGTSITASIMGTFWVRSSGECAIAMDTFHIRQRDLIPEFSLGNDTVICDGSSMELSVPYFPNVNYKWQDGSNGQTQEITRSGKYWLELSIDHCFSTDTVEIIIDNYHQDLGDDVELFCTGIEQFVKLEVRNVPAGADISWSTGEKSYAINVTDSGTYWVHVHQTYRLKNKSFTCSGSDSVNVYIEKCNCFLDAPNAFSPNGDGINDIFIPFLDPTCPAKEYALKIYDRYGKLLFYTRNPSEGWDGTFNGQPLDIGTYFYFVRFKEGASEKEYFKKGDIVLIR